MIRKAIIQMKFEFDKVFCQMMEKCQLDTVILLGHINPDGDASGSVMGTAHYIHAVYPPVSYTHL